MDYNPSIRKNLIKQLIETGKIAGNEAMIKNFFRSEIAYRNTHPEQEEEIAQSIFSIIQAPAFLTIGDDHPCMLALDIAGELDLPPQHRSEEATWENFAKLVEQIKE